MFILTSVKALKFVTMASKLGMFLIFLTKFCSRGGVEKGCNCENRILVSVFKLNFLELPGLFLIGTCLGGNDPEIKKDSVSKFFQILRIKVSISKPLDVNVGCQVN